MDYTHFKEIVDEVKRKKPHLFELEHDQILSMTEIDNIEKRMKIKLPLDYRKFISEFGGGLFGYATVYSLDEKSRYYMFQDGPLVRKGYLPKEYLPVFDNGCGDIYALKIHEKQCLDEIYFYNHERKSVTKTKYANILEYLVEVGMGI
ncbi:MAG: SMI1/KNR4 family protein [Lachnospiraceae bacterium]|nr:SMI1/KNR4 family protein [Lachnospiraceae bacterium]